MIINHNMSAIYANRQLKFNTRAIDKSIERLSSGMRINSAGDDASGLAVSEKMRSQIRGMAQAERNASDGISFIQTTEGYLQETQDILQRLRELSIQSANGIYTKADREQIQVEVDQLVEEIDRIADSAQFNGMKMLTGTYAKGAAGAGAPAETTAWAVAGPPVPTTSAKARQARAITTDLGADLSRSCVNVMASLLALASPSRRSHVSGKRHGRRSRGHPRPHL
jgi:flagellin-like hook-associated protein FlgL